MSVLMPRLNEQILELVKPIRYQVADFAPSTETELFNSDTTMTVWVGQSEDTIFGDPSVNWAFRAWHDALHLKSGLGFTVDEEIELGRRSAAMFDGLIADVVYCEIALQAEHYRQTGKFVDDQVQFLLSRIDLK